MFFLTISILHHVTFLPISDNTMERGDMLMNLAVATIEISTAIDWIEKYYSIPIVIGLIAIFMNTLIDNLGNTPLEEKLRSSSTKFQDKLVLTVVFSIFFTLLMFINLGKGSLLMALIFNFILVFLVWVVSFMILFFFVPRVDFYVKVNMVEWKLVRLNNKNGYLFYRKDSRDSTIEYYKFFQKEDIEQFISKKKPSRFVSIFK